MEWKRAAEGVGHQAVKERDSESDRERVGHTLPGGVANTQVCVWVRKTI